MGDHEGRVFFDRDFDNWMQAQRLQSQLEGNAVPRFSLCLNLGDISPENVQMSITDRVVTVSGYQKEVTEDDDGMIRETFHGFSNEFGLPEGVDANTLSINGNRDQSINIEADYYIPQEDPASPSACHTALPMEDGLSAHDISKSGNFLPSLTSSTLNNSTLRGPLTQSQSFDDSLLEPEAETPATAACRMPSRFDVSPPYFPSQKNQQDSMMHSEDSSCALSPQSSTNEMNTLQNTMCPFPENNAGSFTQFNATSQLSETLQSNFLPSADDSDTQCGLNYSGPSNHGLQTSMISRPDNRAMFSPSSPAVQLSLFQSKTLQQSQVSSVDDSSMQNRLNYSGLSNQGLQTLMPPSPDNNIFPFSSGVQVSPCQMKALQQSQVCSADDSSMQNRLNYSGLSNQALQTLMPPSPANNNFPFSSGVQLSPCQMKARQQSQVCSADDSIMQNRLNYSGLSNQGLQTIMPSSPDNNIFPLSPGVQLSPCQMKALQQSQVCSADDSIMQNRLNYSGLSNQGLQTIMPSSPDNNIFPLSPGVQLSPCQMKALQQNQCPFADNSCGMPSKSISRPSPCQTNARQNYQASAVENNYSNGTGSSTFHLQASPLQQSYRDIHNVATPSLKVPNRPSPCQANRYLFKPGTRCGASPSLSSPRYDYKVPGTRCPQSAKYPPGTWLQNQSVSNANIMRNASTSGLANRTW